MPQREGVNRIPRCTGTFLDAPEVPNCPRPKMRERGRKSFAVAGKTQLPSPEVTWFVTPTWLAPRKIKLLQKRPNEAGMLLKIKDRGRKNLETKLESH